MLLKLANQYIDAKQLEKLKDAKSKAIKKVIAYHVDLALKKLKENPLTAYQEFKKSISGKADSDYQRFINQASRTLWQVDGDDVPYDRISPDEIKDGDNTLIVFTGASVGGQNGKYGVFTRYDQEGKPYFATKYLPKDTKIAMFRYHEYDDAVKFLSQIKAKNIKTQVIGHSWGSDAASTLTENFPELGAPVIIDPVKRINTFSKKAIVYQPETTRPLTSATDRMAFIGGRPTFKHSFKVPGDHTTLVIPAMEHFFKRKLVSKAINAL
jgi:pimeloyl-ACP methyl ester carboxylesterase